VDIAIAFDDSVALGIGLSPVTDLRSAALVRTGAMTTVERWAAVLEVTADTLLRTLIVPGAQAELARDELDISINPADPLDGVDQAAVLLVSARCVLPPAQLRELPVGQAIVEVGSGEPVAVRLTPGAARAFLADLGPGAIERAGAVAAHDADRCLLRRPWDIVRFRDAAIDLDLALLAGALEGQPVPAHATVIGSADAITIARDAVVMPGCVLDATHGPIVLDHEATVRPMAIVQGPAYVGMGSTALERCHVKPHTAIGPVCKVNGEVGGVIFQGYANKAHEGHLGDSYVGKWVNLGAGTTNSNLLNTYTPVKTRVLPGDRYEDTGLVFLGAIIGDHTKTAIGTRLTTGCVIGTGAMLASSATVPQSVRPFTWLTDQREQHFRLSKFLEVAEAAMARRRVELTPAERAQLTALNQAASATG
jgi:UDP-N-acetylglucosamine diphosphorylase/glucosamine-1-phosphate N-acetyltransferase